MDQVPHRQQRGEALPRGLTREAFRRWAEARPGRYELVDGEVVRMNAERAGHIRVKMRVWAALDRAVRDAGLDCQAFGDGFTVEIGERTNYEPDALVDCGPPPGDDEIAAPNPVIVVEVSSPGTQSVDTNDKLADYFRVPSIQHYLVVSPRRQVVIHHTRGVEDRTQGRIVTAGPLRLDPPGLVVTVEEFFLDLQG